MNRYVAEGAVMDAADGHTVLIVCPNDKTPSAWLGFIVAATAALCEEDFTLTRGEACEVLDFPSTGRIMLCTEERAAGSEREWYVVCAPRHLMPCELGGHLVVVEG